MEKARWILVLVASALLVLSCGSTQEQGGAVGGSSSDEPLDGDGDGTVDDVPDEVNDLFSLEDLNVFREAGMNIHTGATPPTVTGAYLADSLIVSYDDLNMGVGLSSFIYTFKAQTASGSITVDYYDEAGDGASDNPGFIAGEESCFSVFADIRGYSSTGDCAFRRPTVFSACVNDSGDLVGFAFGFVMADLDGDCLDTLPLGHHRVIKEADGYARRL